MKHIGSIEVECLGPLIRGSVSYHVWILEPVAINNKEQIDAMLNREAEYLMIRLMSMIQEGTDPVGVLC